MVFESYDYPGIDWFVNRLATADSSSFMFLYRDESRKHKELTGSGEYCYYGLKLDSAAKCRLNGA